MEGLGELGFWLAVGMIIAASIVAGAIKERDKERERLAMLRALAESKSESATEVLAYMRERDAAHAAEAARARARTAAAWIRLKSRTPIAFGIFAFALGVWVFGAVRYGVRHGVGSVLVPLSLMLGIWAAGFVVAWLIRRSSQQKNDANPDA